MAANPTPTNDAVLLARLTDMARACAEHGEGIGLKINTGAVMVAALEKARQARAEVGGQKQDRAARRKALREADAAAERTLSLCRLRLVMFYGPTVNAQWDAAGFPDRSTQVPESQAKRAALLSRLAGWFRTNPALESADMQATAAACEAAHAGYQSARSAVNQRKSALRGGVVSKDQAMRELRKRYRSVIRELNIVLSEADARWRLFGLNVPAHPSAPCPVRSATAERLPDGGWFVTWKRGTHARRYRLRLQRPGGTAFENLATVHGLETRLPPMDLPPDSVLHIIAANDVGEAASCEVKMPED
ncbi:MAG: hypothetical protein IAE77_23050 [Prosthecobacter sp.]|jgi:hypothetical protein|uniref:hypothetical protein n=1 Tax=Prosthecobacter sp. TaxID=1965333 RepID=UPI0019E1472F|nr:hypothetical protein [Prosthecobacter sp.]MBE2286353.1 hypothetical protein [Prosthecobacter sp.]